MDVRFCSEAGTTSREAHARGRMTGSEGMRALLSAPRTLVLFFLTDDLHGWRFIIRPE